MKKVQLWSVQRDTEGKLVSASHVPSVEKTETEEHLEDLLVRSPDLLMDNLTLIGRQIETKGGPLDLLGIDHADGRLIVFELKREKFTRVAVAQAIDYASDLSDMDVDDFVKMIEENSGRNGIDKIEDFAGWYSKTFPYRESVLEDQPKMVLVGIGADPRAVRIINFLAEFGIEISFLMFNAFQQDNSLFFASQVESVPPKSEKAKSEAENLEAFCSYTKEAGLYEFISEVADFIEQKTRARKKQGNTTIAFNLTEHTDEGGAKKRTYINIWLKKKQSVTLTFYEPALRAIGGTISLLKDNFECTETSTDLNLPVPEDKWTDIKKPLEKVLDKMVRERQNNTSD